jgi:hypothetical protein
MTLRLLAAVAIVSASPIFADSFSYTGHFTQDDDVVMFDFDLPAATSVTLRTWSFAGGMNAAGTLIPDDGLAPVLSLFDASVSMRFRISAGMRT